MTLSLEQIVVLANTPEWPVSKSEIVSNSLEDINKEWREILNIIDQLVTCRFIDRNCGKYNIRPEGSRALEVGFDKLEDVQSRIKVLIKARQ